MGAVSLRRVSSRPASARAVLGDGGGRARESAAGVLSISHGPRTALVLRASCCAPLSRSRYSFFIWQWPTTHARRACGNQQGGEAARIQKVDSPQIPRCSVGAVTQSALAVLQGIVDGYEENRAHVMRTVQLSLGAGLPENPPGAGGPSCAICVAV